MTASKLITVNLTRKTTLVRDPINTVTSLTGGSKVVLPADPDRGISSETFRVGSFMSDDEVDRLCTLDATYLVTIREAK